MSPKQSLGDILCLLHFLLLSPQTKYGDLLFLHRFFFFFFSPWTCPTKFSETDDPIFTKLHKKVDPHLKRCTQVLEFSKWPCTIAMETVNICQNLWSHLYQKLPEGFPQDLASILSKVGRIFWPKKIGSEWPPTKLEKFQCSLMTMKIDI